MKREKTACHGNVRNHGIEMTQPVEETDASSDRETDPHPLVSEETGRGIRHCKRELNNWKGEAFTLRPLSTEDRIEAEKDERYDRKQ